jgi:hypothetical protein
MRSARVPQARGGPVGAATVGARGSPVDETRHTVGARWWRGADEQPSWLLDLEAGLQAGDATGQQGRRDSAFAWYAAGRAEYLFGSVPLRPSAGVDFGVNSGDGRPGDGHIGTFRAPFPPGRYFGEANLFWRVSTHDGIYTVAETVLRGASGPRRYVGADVTLVATYRAGLHTMLEAKAARFLAGGFLADNRPNRDTSYFELATCNKF